MEFESHKEVEEYYKKDMDNRQVVVFEGKVYDVKDYMP